MTAGPDAAALMFDSFAARDERKRLTRLELVGTGAGVTEVSVALPTRLRAAGIFVQQRMTIDSQIGDPAVSSCSSPCSGAILAVLQVFFAFPGRFHLQSHLFVPGYD